MPRNKLTSPRPKVILKVALGVALASTLAVSFSGCSRKYLSVEETDIVITFKDEDRDYSAFTTYLLPTQVVDLCSQDGDEENSGVGGEGGASITNCTEADHSLDDVLLDSLRENLNALGYREITDPEVEEPDVAFFAGIVARNNWYLASGGGYCDPYYYYYAGCWYPSYTYAYNLPTSAYLVDMAVVDESMDGKISSAWTVVIKGLAERSDEKSGAQRVSEAVDDAFSQSPYMADGGEK